MAREVHDIVAHSLSVIAVHAEGGRARTARHPQRAPEILETIAETAREALDELVSRLDGRVRNLLPAPPPRRRSSAVPRQKDATRTARRTGAGPRAARGSPPCARPAPPARRSPLSRP
ncbi:histidine kinase dimerization/phosphoacceptor domain-containing protein [Nonomuraea glycinis]|uniref:histidine kinase dimerization/phosphoacceptor domain-containing protein n=1 Tax=Nonomuraea glycinis TaxID=2047744 RepID=UPI0033A14A9A